MSYIIVIVTSLAWAILASAYLTLAPSNLESARIERDGAIVVCEEPVYDFGTVWVGEELCHTFVLKNEGSETAYLRAWPCIAGTTNKRVIVLEPSSEYPVSDCLKSRKLNGPFEKAWAVELVPPPQAKTVQTNHEVIPIDPLLENGGTTAIINKTHQSETSIPISGETATYRGVKLVCENPIFDFGTIWVNQTVRHEYVIRNVGTETGRICIHWHGYGPYSFSYPKTETILPGGVLRIPFGWTYHRGREYTEGDVFTLTILPADGDDTRCHTCGQGFDTRHHKIWCK